MFSNLKRLEEITEDYFKRVKYKLTYTDMQDVEHHYDWEDLQERYLDEDERPYSRHCLNIKINNCKIAVPWHNVKQANYYIEE